MTQPIEEPARALRRDLTPAERALWATIRGRQVAGLRFRCQHPVGPFVLDFFCPAAKLVSEVDGPIRFTNEQVPGGLAAVLDTIVSATTTVSADYRARRAKPTVHETAEPPTP